MPNTLPTALVTGASSGIGAAIAQTLSKQGYEILLLGRNEKRLKDTVSQLDGPSRTLVCDLSDLNAIKELSSQLLEKPPFEGSLKLLVNNAGIFQRKPFLETDISEWQNNWQINLLGPVALTKYLLPELQKNKPAQIINIASSLGLKPVAQTSAYSALKAGLLNWTQCLALEMAPDIRVNSICPGLVETPIHDFHGDPEKRKTVDPFQPMKRVGQPEDIAHAVSYLADANWVTGTHLTVDGGISLA